MSRDDASGSCTVLVGKNDILDTPSNTPKPTVSCTPWPFNPETHTARRDVEFIRKGMPVHGLLVWLSERRYRWLLSEWEITCPSVLRWVFPPPASRYDETAAEL
jgi:hypothetical protein